MRMKHEDGIVVKISADTTEFEKSMDRCIAKAKELIQLCKQVGKLFDEDIRI